MTRLYHFNEYRKNESVQKVINYNMAENHRNRQQWLFNMLKNFLLRQTIAKLSCKLIHVGKQIYQKFIMASQCFIFSPMYFSRNQPC